MSNGIIDLSASYPSAEKIEEGFDTDLQCGLRVRLARTNSPRFQQFAAKAQRRFGGRKREIPPEKSLESVIYVMARATFLGFSGKVKCGGEIIDDSIAAREKILLEYPDLRDEIAELVTEADEDYRESVGEAGKG